MIRQAFLLGLFMNFVSRSTLFVSAEVYKQEPATAFPSRSRYPSSSPSGDSPAIDWPYEQESSTPTKSNPTSVPTSTRVNLAPKSVIPIDVPSASPVSYAPSTVEPTLSPFIYAPLTSAPTSASPTMSSENPVGMPMKVPVSLPCRDLENFPFFVNLSIGTQTCIWLRSSSRSAEDIGTLCSSTDPLGYGYVLCAKTCRRC